MEVRQSSKPSMRILTHAAVAPTVIRNDELTWKQLRACLPDVDNIVISPGPGSPCNPTDIGTM